MPHIEDNGTERPFHFGAPYRPTDEQDWRRGVCARLAGEATDSPAFEPAEFPFHANGVAHD
jgi:hypothetical protein